MTISKFSIIILGVCFFSLGVHAQERPVPEVVVPPQVCGPALLKKKNPKLYDDLKDFFVPPDPRDYLVIESKGVFRQLEIINEGLAPGRQEGSQCCPFAESSPSGPLMATFGDLIACEMVAGSPMGSPFSFSIEQLLTFSPPTEGGNPLLWLAHDLDCRLGDNLSEKELLSILDRIIEDQRIIGFSFYSILLLIERLERQGKHDFLNNVLARLRSSSTFLDFLRVRLINEKLNLLVKIIYFDLYRDINPHRQLFHHVNRIKAQGQTELIKAVHEDDEKTQREMADLLSLIVANDLADDKFIEEVAKETRAHQVISGIVSGLKSPLWKKALPQKRFELVRSLVTNKFTDVFALLDISTYLDEGTLALTREEEKTIRAIIDKREQESLKKADRRPF